MDTLLLTDILCDEQAFIIRRIRNSEGRPVDDDTVALYAEEPERLPPVEVWRDPESDQVYLLDGQHRYEAHRRRALEGIWVVYFEGTRLEAEARARVANFKHGLRLGAAEQRQARLEVIERLYEYSNNWLAEDFLGCSPNTVAALRASLEEAGRIPRLGRFKRKNGGTIPRNYEDGEVEADDMPDATAIQPPPGMIEAGPEPDGSGGGYRAEEDGGGEELNIAPPPGAAEPAPSPWEGEEFSRRAGRPRQTTLKLAQLGEALAAEVVLYLDGQPYSIPATLLIADGAISGVPETAPDHQQVLVIGRQIAEEMGLLF